MSNSITSTGAEIGDYGGVIKQVYDLSSESTGRVFCSSSVTLTATPTRKDYGNVTLPSLAVGKGKCVAYYSQYNTYTDIYMNFYLPSGGSYLCGYATNNSRSNYVNSATVDMNKVYSGGASVLRAKVCDAGDGGLDFSCCIAYIRIS